jgi:hypothetical protein
MWMDRWTDMMKLIGAFCRFAKCPKRDTGERKEVHKNTEGYMRR